MIDWPTIKAELAAAIVRVTGFAPEQVIWRDEAVGATFHLEPAVYLRLSSVRRQGIEEERLTYNGPSANQTVLVAGQRRFTLSIRCESFEQDISTVRFAGNVADAIATRIMRSSTRAQISSFAIEQRLGTTWFNYKSGARQVSCYVVDFLLRTVDNDLDTSTDAGGWIGEAQVSGTVDAIPLSIDVKT